MSSSIRYYLQLDVIRGLDLPVVAVLVVVFTSDGHIFLK